MSYLDYKKKADEKIRQYGSPCKLIRKLEGEYNPETNEYESGEIIINGYAVQSNYNQEVVDGTNIKAEDILLTCSFNEKPYPSDEIEYAGKKYVIVPPIKELNPNGMVAIYYKIQAR